MTSEQFAKLDKRVKAARRRVLSASGPADLSQLSITENDDYVEAEKIVTRAIRWYRVAGRLCRFDRDIG